MVPFFRPEKTGSRVGKALRGVPFRGWPGEVTARVRTGNLVMSLPQ